MILGLIKKKLKPKKILVVDDQSPDKAQLADYLAGKLRTAGVQVDRQTVSRTATDFSSLIARIDTQTSVVMLSFQTATEGQLFGQQMKEQAKLATIVGANGVYSPSQFTIDGSYVASFAPTAQEAQDVRHWAQGVGLSVARTSPDNLLVTVRGTTRSVERALGSRRRGATCSRR